VVGRTGIFDSQLTSHRRPFWRSLQGSQLPIHD
jgi:hypothetical protein